MVIAVMVKALNISRNQLNLLSIFNFKIKNIKRPKTAKSFHRFSWQQDFFTFWQQDFNLNMF